MGRACDMNRSVSASSDSKHMTPRTDSSDYEIAANKVLAALGALRGNVKAFKYTGGSVKALELPDGDQRKHMIPRVVLRDIGDVLARVSPKLYMPSKAGSPNVGEKRNKGWIQSRKTAGNGFLGFPDHANSKTAGARFHVNTNILANSLDLLNGRATVNIDSPCTCDSCGITFSSIRHCKYHQSVCAASLPYDSSRHSSVQDADGVWLCPWCPVMCSKLRYLNQHKPFCREKGKCTIGNNSSSQRNSQKRRNTTSQVDQNQLSARCKPIQRTLKLNKFCAQLNFNSENVDTQYPVVVIL